MRFGAWKKYRFTAQYSEFLGSPGTFPDVNSDFATARPVLINVGVDGGSRVIIDSAVPLVEGSYLRGVLDAEGTLVFPTNLSAEGRVLMLLFAQTNTNPWGSVEFYQYAAEFVGV